MERPFRSERREIRLRGALLALPVLLIVLGVACSGGDDGSPTATPTTVCTPTAVEPTDLVAPVDAQTQLEAIVFQPDELPGLQRSSLAFSTNEDLVESAADPEAELARLDEIGRVLGAQTDFVPIDAASSATPVRGVQNSVSVYRDADGASESLQESIEETRLTDWESLYPDLTGVNVREITRSIGDEGTWFRVTGFDPGNLPIADDQVVFRVGRARAFVRVFAQFEDEAAVTPFEDQVVGCAEIIVDRAREILEG